MSSTYAIRRRLIDIARTHAGKRETSRNRANWITPLWQATDNPTAWQSREPYCAAGMAWSLREWLKLPDVLAALKLTPAQAEKWRCKSGSVFKYEPSNWLKWAKEKKLAILPAKGILHAADLVIYTYSHIELVTDDDGTEDGGFTAIGYNTDDAASRDGDGCFEKPRTRASVRCLIRILP